MNFSYRQAFKFFFRLLCTIAFAFMVGYWLYYYEIEDRDIGLVDYTQLKDAKEIEFPAISLCINDPFIDETLKAMDPQIESTYSYYQFLAGEIYNDTYERIEYANATIDLRK